MREKMNGDSNWQTQVLERITVLEDKLSSLEKKLELSARSQAAQPDVDLAASQADLEFISVKQLNMESRIGEFGMAWLGNIVLLFGGGFALAS